MPRLLLAAVLLVALSGCSATRTVSRGDARGLAAVDAAVRGRQATVELTSGVESWGRMLFVRPDSTAWVAYLDRTDTQRRTVPTPEVAALVLNGGRREGGIRGLRIGAGVGLGVATVAFLAMPRTQSTASDGAGSRAAGALVGLAAIVAAPLIGRAVGSIGEGPAEYRFTE